MKKLIKYNVIIVYLILQMSSYGQNRLVYENSFTIVDTTEYEFIYKLEFIEDITKPEEKLIDTQVLQIGDYYSFYFSELLYINDSINTVLEDSDAKKLLSQPKGAAGYDILRDKNSKTFEVRDRSSDVVFRYIENIPTLTWAIQNDKKTIQHYTCQRATTTFRGREYEAWFTFEIPIPEGPYKFGGLPGMILEMNDSQNQFVFTCIEIERTNQPIKIRNWHYTKTTRLELHHFLIKKYNDLSGYYKSRGTTMWIHKDSKFIEAPANYKMPFNPIELE